MGGARCGASRDWQCLDGTIKIRFVFAERSPDSAQTIRVRRARIDSDISQPKQVATLTGETRVQIDLTCRHGDINDYAHEHITGKAEKLLTFFERVTAIQITIDFENGRAKAEILVDAEHKHNFVAHHVGDDVISAFDTAYQKMEQQIKKYKEKIQDHRRDKPLGEAFPGPNPESAATET